jgi:lysine 2,3-aminomutase
MTMETIFFKELISPFIKRKLDELGSRYGRESSPYLGLARQYIQQPMEQTAYQDERDRHYDAHADFIVENKHIPGLERLYRRGLVIEPTMICAAHCRYCLRANYKTPYTLSEEELLGVAKFCGSQERKDALHEVLITGGDPLIIPNRLAFLVDALIEFAPNIKIMRIATRLPQQAPSRITNTVYRIFQKREGVRFELATQINHPVELSFPETVEIFKTFRNIGVVIYSQNVLLKGVNDDLSVLIDLYDAIRDLGIEAHYLFHCIPLRGMSHMRTSVEKGLQLTNALVNSGHISGRAKPMYAAMTDIGKITFYENTILQKDPAHNSLLLQSQYLDEERKTWNPSWALPSSAEVDENGRLRVWYLDGIDD